MQDEHGPAEGAVSTIPAALVGEVALARAVEDLRGMLAGPLPKDAAGRDHAIHEAHERNYSLRESAEATSFSVPQVHRIVVRELADRQVVKVEE